MLQDLIFARDKVWASGAEGAKLIDLLECTGVMFKHLIVIPAQK